MQFAVPVFALLYACQNERKSRKTRRTIVQNEKNARFVNKACIFSLFVLQYKLFQALLERKNELNVYFSIQNLIYGDVFVAYANLSKAELQKVFDELSAEYKGYQAKNLSLNMARGKPSAKQLELALGVL